MKFSQIRKLVEVLVLEDENTVSNIKPRITVELGQESMMQLNQDIHSNYPDFLSLVKNKVEGNINMIDIQGYKIYIKKISE